MKTETVKQRKKLASVFDALGHHRRIAIVIELQRAGQNGITFGDLARQSLMPDSALKHHVNMMKRGGLISIHIKGNFTVLHFNAKQLSVAMSVLGFADMRT